MQSDYVVLVHGLGRTSNSMRKPCKFFTNKGYTVLNFAYASKRSSIEKSAATLEEFVTTRCCEANPERIHFFSHSMGGIIIRALLKQRKLRNLGRVVMLAPPSQGSELADHLKHLRLYKWILGAAGQQLGTDTESLPNRLGAVDFEVGIIAANRSINPFGSLVFPGADDGMVSVDRTKIEGMKSFITVPQVHALIMNNEAVLEQANHFLNYGYFLNQK